MMLRMRDIVLSEQPDAFLICGDVFHTSTPGIAIQRLFVDAVLSLHNAKPDMAIVITSGNHDSGARLETFRQLWDVVGVTVVGHLDADHPENHIVEVAGKGYVIAVPYSYERLLSSRFFTTLQRLVAERNTDGLPVVMTAHTTVAGCDYKGHDNSSELSVGGIDSLGVDFFGDGYDYLALGHIHRPQNVPVGGSAAESGRREAVVRYSGSPLAVSFDETYGHSVSLVEIGSRGAKPLVRELPVENPRPLVTLPARDAASLDDALSLLRGFDADSEAYIRLNVAVDGLLPPTANADAIAATEGKQCRFCLINALRIAKDGESSEPSGMTVSELQRIEPCDLARGYAESKGLTFDADLFAEVVRSLRNDA